MCFFVMKFTVKYVLFYKMSARGSSSSKLRVRRFRIRQRLYRRLQNIMRLSRREAPEEAAAEVEQGDVVSSEISALGETYEDQPTVAMETNDQNSNIKIK